MATKRSSETERAPSALPPRRKTATSTRTRKKLPAVVSEVTAASAPVTGTEPAAAYQPEYQEVAALAYSYWESRGCQGGCPEEDWLRAEQELRTRAISAAAV